MGFNKKRYKKAKEECQNNINKGHKDESDYMRAYKSMITTNDFESAKAVSEVLWLLDYDVCHTHNHIECLKLN
jgi:hypothetical protein